MFIDYLTLTLAVINIGTMGFCFFQYEVDEEVDDWLAVTFGLITFSLSLFTIIGAFFK